MHKFHVTHLFAILVAGAISLPLLASTTSAAAASARTTSPIETQLAGLKGAAMPRATSVGSVSFASSDRQGAMSANWTVDASTGASGALSSGIGTITIVAPASTTFPLSSSAYSVNGNPVTATPTAAGGTVTITTPTTLGDSSAFSVVITGVTNPAAGTYASSSFSVSTSADSTASNAVSGLSFGTVLSGVSFSPSPSVALGSATWTVGFTTSANGALGLGDTITIRAPASTTFPSSSSAFKVNGATVTAIPATAGGTVTIASPTPLGNSTTVSVQMIGVTNPAASFYPNTSFSASTTADAAASPTSGQTFSVGSTTTTGLGLSSASVAYGSETSEIFTVTVTGLSGEGYPEGTVAVYNSSTELCSATLAPVSSYSAVVTCALAAYELAGGAYDDVFATYIPGIPSSSNSSYAYGASSSTPVQAFSVGSTTTTGLGLSSASVAYGSETSEIFTVTVTGLSGEGYPEGTVAVYNSSTELCSATLAPVSSYSAVVTCALAAYELAGGAYDDVFATYIPGIPSSSNSSYAYGASSSTPVQAFSVGSASATSTTVSESQTKVTYGHESASVISVTVTTNDGGAAPNGEKVTVHVGAVTCKAALKGGKGTCRVAKTALPVGSYPVSATYGGDANLRGSSGSSVSGLTVNKDATRTSVSESPANVTYGHESASLISAAVTTRYGEAVPNGESVTVSVGPVTCTAVLKGGSGNCRIATTALSVGSYPVLATYGGDANLSGSSVSELTVSKDATRTTVSESPTRVTYGHESASVFSVAVTTHHGEAVPDGEKVTVHVGNVTCTAVLNGGDGTCTIANNALAVGSYPVQATYGGDANLSSSSGSSASRLTV